MSQVESSPDYVSYLVRIWREGAARESSRGPGEAIWRASVVSVNSGERRGFASLDDLVAFLKRHEESAAAREERSPDNGGR